MIDIVKTFELQYTLYWNNNIWFDYDLEQYVTDSRDLERQVDDINVNWEAFRLGWECHEIYLEGF